MPLERIGDTGPDLVEGGRRLCIECLEIHVASPKAAVLGGSGRDRRWRAVNGLPDDCCGGFG
jgi:hypothetical protein